MNYLLQLWQAVDGASQDTGSKPFLIYLESSLVIRAIRDYFQPDIGEILIDTQEMLVKAHVMHSVELVRAAQGLPSGLEDIILFR